MRSSNCSDVTAAYLMRITEVYSDEQKEHVG